MVSCSNEFQVNAPHKPVPVVYCVLNPGDTVHYLRLEKSFNGAASALDMAREYDSVFYPEATVAIERWENGQARERLSLERKIFTPRDSGIFLSEPNPLYVLESKLRANSEYRLSIRVPGTSEEISSITRVIDDFRIIRPEYYRTNLPFSSYDNHLDVEWVSARYTRIFHLRLRFHYLEVTGPDTLARHADWNLANFVTDHDGGGQSMNHRILHRNFYVWLGNKIPAPEPGVTRLADRKAIDLWFTVGGDELYTYLQVHRPDDLIPRQGLVYSNIINGIGLFSSRFEKGITGKSISYHSIDSLAVGIYTRHLGFADSRNGYYRF